MEMKNKVNLNRFGIMSHEERLTLILKPLPIFNIIRTSYAGASKGLSYPITTLCERRYESGSSQPNK